MTPGAGGSARPTAEVRVLRVLSVRANRPTIVAHVGETNVRWSLTGWECGCGSLSGTCEHVAAVVSILDPRVLGASW